MTADHGPLCPNGVRCPDCGWPVPPEHDAAIAARALREAADDLDAGLDPLRDEFDDGVAWAAQRLRARVEQVSTLALVIFRR